jgi:hypothetical protein
LVHAVLGATPDSRVGEEILWEIDEHARLFIEPNAARAGAGRITLAIVGLDALLERLAAQRIEHEPIETYSNGVRHVELAARVRWLLLLATSEPVCVWSPDAVLFLAIVAFATAGVVAGAGAVSPAREREPNDTARQAQGPLPERGIELRRQRKSDDADVFYVKVRYSAGAR